MKKKDFEAFFTRIHAWRAVNPYYHVNGSLCRNLHKTGACRGESGKMGENVLKFGENCRFTAGIDLRAFFVFLWCVGAPSV